MTELSPQAQAVLDAFLAEWDVYAVDEARHGIAAALRALADQNQFADVSTSKTVLVVQVDHILAIATELEGVPVRKVAQDP